MEEKVSLMMMPVCICGHVFNDLRLEYLGMPVIHSGTKYRVGDVPKFVPYKCPSCHREIQSVRARDPRVNELGGILNNPYMVFITPDDKPTIVS